jgi:hypothetical protein
MLSKQGIRVSSLTRGKPLLTIGSAAMFLAVFLLGGTLHATPIMDGSGWHVRNSKQPSSYAVLSQRGRATPQLAMAVNSAPGADSQRSQQSSASSGCILASNCTNPVHIPEPEALAVFGTGLLFLAGMLRRRLAR